MIPRDKLHHIVYSYAAMTLAALFVPIGWAVLAVVAFGAFKEVFLDGLWRRGTPEYGDFVADVVGVALACFVVGRLMM